MMLSAAAKYKMARKTYEEKEVKKRYAMATCYFYFTFQVLIFYL